MITLLNILKQIILYLMLLLISGKTGVSQAFFEAYLYGENQNLRAVAAVQMLQESALVVRLQSNNKKLTRLKELSESASLDKKKQEKFRKEAEVLILETQHQQSVWINAFMELYSFSDVYFLEDSDYKAFLSGSRNGIFINEQGVKDPGIKFNQLYYLVAGFGSSRQPDQYSGGAGMYIMDARGNELNNPFPHFLTARFYDQVLGLVMNDGSREKRNAEKIVSRLQKKLDRYCSKVCGEILPPLNP
jgi:hypothetical protein